MKFQISYPFDTHLPSQVFGANPDFYSQPQYGGIKGHNGIDFIAQHGYPVYATHDGMAEFQIDPGGGHGVVITTENEFEYKDGTAQFKTIYWHLVDGVKEPQLKSPFEGAPVTRVKNGDLIGYADNTGASTGDHLHFGLKPIKNGVNIEQNNGFLGAIDPTPYFDGSTPSIVHNLEQQVSFLKKILDLIKQKLSGIIK